MEKQENITSSKELTYSELMLLTDDQLRELFLLTRSKIIKGQKFKKDTTEIEIYNCYITKAIEDKAR
jgi:hypothetical protein